MRLLYTRSEVGQHTAYIDQCTQSFDRDGPCIRSLRTKLSFPYDFYPSTHPPRRGLQLPAVFSSGGANLSQSGSTVARGPGAQVLGSVYWTASRG